MKFFSFPVKRPVTVSVLAIAIMIVGLMFGSRLNVEGFPKIDVPVIAISTVYKGAGPEEVEDQISIKIEDAAGSVSNIDELESTSQDSLSVVIVRFKYGTDMNTAAADIREKLDKIKGDLPDEAEDPVITKADPADTPVVRLCLTSKNGNLRRARSIADEDVKKELEKIAGVASVKVSGGEERAIVIKPNKNRMELLSISPLQIAQAVARENADVPSGRITADMQEFSVRAKGQMTSMEDFKNIYISTVGGKPIFLKDVATVADDKKEVRTYARYNGDPAVSIEVRRNTDANEVNIAREVQKTALEMNKDLPAGMEIHVSYDKSFFVLQAINNLRETGIQGAIFAMLVVLMFLGSFRSTGVIAMSIPFSIISTFLLMYFVGYTINMMTLVGFILAIGNIVDASNVVMENIFRHLEMGKGPKEAAIDGVQEVGGAVAGGVLTTVLVFIPIFLMQGLSGQIFRPLAGTFCFALIASLITAITIVPMLSSRFLSVKDVISEESMQRKKGLSLLIDKTINGVTSRMRSIYKTMLVWSLKHRFIVIVLVLTSFGVSIYLAGFLKVALQGKWDRGDFLVKIETPVGSSLNRTQQAVSDVERFFMENVPENQYMVADIGQGPSGAQGAGASGGSENPRLGGLTIVLQPAEIRQAKKMRTMYQVQDDIVAKFKDYPGAKIQVSEIMSISGKKPIEILIQGENLNKLSEIAEDIKKQIAGVPGVINLDTNYRPGSPEYRIIIDREKAAYLGLDSSRISAILRRLMSEDKVSSYREEGKEYDIFVQLPLKQRDSIRELENLKIITASGSQVPLKEIARIIPDAGPSQITRKNRTRYIAVQADISSDRALSEVKAEVMPILENYKFPSGYKWSLAGEEQKRQEIFGEMFQVLGLSVIFLYVFLAIQFESFIHPFTIMAAVPLELTGVFGSLLIFNQVLTMFALLGIIMLGGIVVNAGIILIDFFNQRKEAGMSTMEAIIESAPLRLRPITMTTLSTIFGMVPLAFMPKAGSEMYQPLAVGAVGGLAFSTLLTLLVIPVVYSLFEDLSERLSSKKS